MHSAHNETRSGETDAACNRTTPWAKLFETKQLRAPHIPDEGTPDSRRNDSRPPPHIHRLNSRVLVANPRQHQLDDPSFHRDGSRVGVDRRR